MKLVQVALGKKTATVDASIAPNLKRADDALYRAVGNHINVSYSYRSTELQRQLYEQRKPGQRVAPPGKSFHEKGLAVDVVNWQEAQPYLRAQGFRNDLADDRGHFSVGEFGKSAIVKGGIGFSAVLVFAGIVYLLTRR
jgi:hypothetical protein